MPMDFNSLSENAQNKAFEDWWQEQLSLYSEDVIQDMYPDKRKRLFNCITIIY